jgi:hypothetical protein
MSELVGQTKVVQILDGEITDWESGRIQSSNDVLREHLFRHTRRTLPIQSDFDRR